MYSCITLSIVLGAISGYPFVSYCTFLYTSLIIVLSLSKYFFDLFKSTIRIPLLSRAQYTHTIKTIFNFQICIPLVFLFLSLVFTSVSIVNIFKTSSSISQKKYLLLFLPLINFITATFASKAFGKTNAVK